MCSGNLISAFCYWKLFICILSMAFYVLRYYSKALLSFTNLYDILLIEGHASSMVEMLFLQDRNEVYCNLRMFIYMIGNPYLYLQRFIFLDIFNYTDVSLFMHFIYLLPLYPNFTWFYWNCLINLPYISLKLLTPFQLFFLLKHKFCRKYFLHLLLLNDYMSQMDHH